MIDIDIKSLAYEVELTVADGTIYDMTNVMQVLVWEDHKSELAQRATLTVTNAKVGNARLHAIAQLTSRLKIIAKWNGGGSAVVFNGIVWEHNNETSKRKNLTLTAYDPMIYLQRSKDFRYYRAGMSTRSIINDICTDWNISLQYTWTSEIVHEKKVFNATRISEMIIELIDEVADKTGNEYAVFFRDGALRITNAGANTSMYLFESSNTEMVSNIITLNNLVTRVKIIGKQDDDGNAPVEATVDGNIRLGILQEIVNRSGDTSLEEARKEASSILKERGNPDEIRQIDVPDVPFIRKGDRIEVNAGDLQGEFIVEGVTHTATTRRMMMMIKRRRVA